MNKTIRTTVILTVINLIFLMIWKHFAGFEIAVLYGIASAIGSIGAVNVERSNPK